MTVDPVVLMNLTRFFFTFLSQKRKESSFRATPADSEVQRSAKTAAQQKIVNSKKERKEGNPHPVVSSSSGKTSSPKRQEQDAQSQPTAVHHIA